MKQIFMPKLDFNYVGVEISSNITMAMAQEQRRFVDQVAAYAGSRQGVYIVLEGADLTGKSSQCWNILKLLRDNTNLSIQLVEEPGGTPGRTKSAVWLRIKVVTYPPWRMLSCSLRRGLS